jgi:hypothetical protein
MFFSGKLIALQAELLGGRITGRRGMPGSANQV